MYQVSANDQSLSSNINLEIRNGFVSIACADQESLVRGGPTLTTFFF